MSQQELREAPRQAQPRPGVPRPRLRSVGTKVSDELYARIVEAAGPQRISEWLRQVATAAASQPSPTLLLAEVLALRTIVLNLHAALAAGEVPTPDLVQRLIERADRDRFRKVQERLTQAYPPVAR